MKTTAKTFTAEEAATLARFFARLAQQIETADREGRTKDCLSLCSLAGALQVRIFMLNSDGYLNVVTTLFDTPGEIEYTEDAPEKPRGRDTDDAYEEMVDEEMGCM